MLQDLQQPEGRFVGGFNVLPGDIPQAADAGGIIMIENKFEGNFLSAGIWLEAEQVLNQTPGNGRRPEHEDRFPVGEVGGSKGSRPFDFVADPLYGGSVAVAIEEAAQVGGHLAEVDFFAVRVQGDDVELAATVQVAVVDHDFATQDVFKIRADQAFTDVQRVPSIC